MTKQELYGKMQDILDAADAENRGLTEPEKRQFDKYDAEFRMLGIPETRGVGGRRTAEDEAFTRYLRTGDMSGLQIRADGTGFSSAPNDAGLSGGSTGNFAGYMVPQGFWRNLQIALKAFGGAANDFRLVETPTGAPYPWPTTDPTGVTASVLGASNELNQLSIADSYTFGQGMLNAWTIYTNPLLASLQLVQDAAFDVDQFVSDRIGEAVGRELASLAISGTGSGQPLGIVTALNAKGAWSAGSSGGFINLTAATTVKTFATSNPTELGGNILAPSTLISMVQAVDPAYYPTSKFYMNSTQAWNLRSTVDSNGRPLLDMIQGLDNDPNVTSADYNTGSPIATLFGFPILVDNNIPNLTASTTGGPVFGSLSHAMVNRRVTGANLMRLDERYADFLAIGYIGFVRCDFRSNDLRAAVTVKPAST